MNQFIQPILKASNILNGNIEECLSCAPLYAGLFISDCYQSTLTFQLDTIHYEPDCPVYITLSIYCRQLTTNSATAGGVLRIGVLNSENLDTDFASQITADNANTNLTFNLTALIEEHLKNNAETITLIIYPDSNLNSLVSFDSIGSQNPPYLTVYAMEKCSDCKCSPSVQFFNYTTGLDTFAQVFNPNYTVDVSTNISATGVNFISLSNNGLPQCYYTAGFSLTSTAGVPNDTLSFPKTGMYQISVSLIFIFYMPDDAVNGDGFTVIFNIQNQSGSYIQNLLYLGVVPDGTQNDLVSYQVDITFLYNSTTLPDGILIGLSTFAFNSESTTNPDNIRVGNLVLDAIRIGNSPCR